MMDEKLRKAYENLENALGVADNEGYNYIRQYWLRPDGKLEITSDGITYMVILERKN